MALVLTDPALLEPKIKLAQALHDYETILSDEDKSQLHSQGFPDATAAIKLIELLETSL